MVKNELHSLDYDVISLEFAFFLEWNYYYSLNLDHFEFFNNLNKEEIRSIGTIKAGNQLNKNHLRRFYISKHNHKMTHKDCTIEQ